MSRNYIVEKLNEKGQLVKETVDEKGLRDFAMTFSPEKGKKAFKQDFRLVAGARTKPISELVDMLEQQGAVIERAD